MNASLRKGTSKFIRDGFVPRQGQLTGGRRAQYRPNNREIHRGDARLAYGPRRDGPESRRGTASGISPVPNKNETNQTVFFWHCFIFVCYESCTKRQSRYPIPPPRSCCLCLWKMFAMLTFMYSCRLLPAHSLWTSSELNVLERFEDRLVDVVCYVRVMIHRDESQKIPFPLLLLRIDSKDLTIIKETITLYFIGTKFFY